MRARMLTPFDLRAASGSVKYFGGPVIANVKVVSVIWGSNVARATVVRIGPFLSALVNSNFVDQLGQYSTTILYGTQQTIVRGRFLGQVRITPYDKYPTVNDRAIQVELQKQIAAGRLPKADANTLYMIYFPFNVTDKSLGGSCVKYEAYHASSSATVQPGNLYYTVMPDCGLGFDELTIASSHEFAEAVTDQIPTPGTQPAYPQAWNTANGYEIADLCEGTKTTLTAGTRRYYVQQVYLDSIAACAKGKFTSP
jgi:hypothetical protein